MPLQVANPEETITSASTLTNEVAPCPRKNCALLGINAMNTAFIISSRMLTFVNSQ